MVEISKGYYAKRIQENLPILPPHFYPNAACRVPEKEIRQAVLVSRPAVAYAQGKAYGTNFGLTLWDKTGKITTRL